jgi:hypothetical protein
MKAQMNPDETYIIVAKTVFDFAKRAKEIFMSSKMSGKQQLLNFVFSKFELDRERSFVTFAALSHQPVSLQILGTLGTFDWIWFKDKFLLPSQLISYKPVGNNVSRRIQ